MSTTPLYQERQKFSHWLLWVVLFSINILLIYGLVKIVFFDQPHRSNWINITVLLGVIMLYEAICYVFYIVQLETIIKEDGIYVRFFPIIRKLKYYKWNNIEQCYIRTYSSLREYGGWGFRFGFGDKGNAWNISGNKGLQLVFKNGRKLLIGTKTPQELESVLINLHQIKIKSSAETRLGFTHQKNNS